VPDPIELLDAAEQLIRDGFIVLPYTNDDPYWPQTGAGRLAAAVMPWARRIGTGLGNRNRTTSR